MNIVSYIPVRGGSKSIPYKNIKYLNGKPLLFYHVDAALNCNLIDKIYVATDSLKIKKVVKLWFKNLAEIIDRDYVIDSALQEEDMLKFANTNNFDHIILHQVTSPLITEHDLTDAINYYRT